MEIRENEIYTSSETKTLLKISQSTFLRLIKKGVLRAYKVGGQYRILGKSILHLVNPKLEEKVARVYYKVRDSKIAKSIDKIAEGV